MALLSNGGAVCRIQSKAINDGRRTGGRGKTQLDWMLVLLGIYEVGLASRQSVHGNNLEILSRRDFWIVGQFVKLKKRYRQCWIWCLVQLYCTLCNNVLLFNS
jgi:hypothetical protein